MVTLSRELLAVLDDLAERRFLRFALSSIGIAVPSVLALALQARASPALLSLESLRNERSD